MTAPDLFLDFFAVFAAKFKIYNLLRINHSELQYWKRIHYSLQTLLQHQYEEKEETKPWKSGKSFCQEEKNLYLHCQ